MFRYDWSQFNTRMGLIFMVGVLVVFNLMGRFDFSMFAAGISALLAWLTVILVPQQRWKQHLIGLMVYLIVGTALTWLANQVTPYPLGSLAAMGIVTFCGYMMLLRGAHHFMVAWCLVYWFLLVPLFLGDREFGSVVLGHVIGAGLVTALNLMKPVWSRAIGKDYSETDAAEGSAQDLPPFGFVVRYATIVSLSIVAGVAAGTRWVTSDPTLIANATLNVISPSLRRTWQGAIERVVLGSAGIVGGFYCGWFFPDPWVGQLVTIICSFLALATLYVNAGLVIGVFFFLISYPWGVMHSALGHQIANEKLLGELLGVIVAVVAIAILTRLPRRRQSPKKEG